MLASPSLPARAEVERTAALPSATAPPDAAGEEREASCAMSRGYLMRAEAT